MKSIFKSKVFYFNILTVLMAVATFFGYIPEQKLAENTTDFLFAVSPLINIVLRFWTSKSVSFSGK